MFVPVVDKDNKPLMPTLPSRARKWIASNKATPFWKRGVFCVRINQKTLSTEKQEIAVGIDTGIKKEAFTVKSDSHTYLNIQTDAVTWVKDAVETRKYARMGRRKRNTPCRAPKHHRKGCCLSPSIKARWQWKLRILNWLKLMYPISFVIVEDIKAKSKGRPGWDKSFSPLQFGKNWFYNQIGSLDTKYGWETKALREMAGLKKSSDKLSTKFESHCVDSWVLANWKVGGHIVPDNKTIIYMTSLRFHRRQLHAFKPSKKGKRRTYGGTMSLGWKRGSIVKHNKYGITRVGGSFGGNISLHSINSKKLLTEYAHKKDCKWLSFSSFRIEAL